MSDQLFEGMEPSWESPADILKGDDLYRYHIDNAQEMFGHESMLAFQKFEKDHNWIALAEALWELFSGYIGLGSPKQPNGASSRSPYADLVYNNMKKNGKSLLSFFFDNSFRMLDEQPKEKACEALKGLRRRVESDRDVEFATSQGTSEAIEMYKFFLDNIKRELSHQQDRTDEAPKSVLPEAQTVIVEEKIQQEKYRDSLQHKEEFNHAQAAVYLELSEKYLYRLTYNHKIEYSKQGKKNKYKKSELDVWLKENRRDIRSRAGIDSLAATYVALHKGVVNSKETFYRKERNIQKDPVRLPAKKQEVKKVITPIKWKESEALLKGVAAGLHKKGFVSDEQSFVNQFHVIEVAGGQKECNATEWTGDKTALTYLFSELQKLGAVFQKIKIWETVALHFTAEGKPINNLKQAKYGYSGGKPKAAPMIDEILAIFSVSK